MSGCFRAVKLKECGSVKAVCEWLKDKGISPGENAYVGTVHPVHSATSLHYRTMRDGKIIEAPNKQGNLAIDINNNSLGDDNFRRDFKTEGEALTFLWHRFVAVFGPDGYDVLDECFHNGFGFIKETPDRNHAIGGHDGHMHAAFKRLKWAVK